MSGRLGVHYMTAYRYVRLGLLPAEKLGGQWAVSFAELEAFQAHSSQRKARGRYRGTDRVGVDWSKRYEARLVAGDGSGAFSVLEAGLVSGAGMDEVYDEIIGPALARIGERWVAGEIDVNVEHHASTLVRRHVSRLAVYGTRRGPSRGVIVVGCVQGERHDLGVSMIADVFRGQGFDVIDLGADTPASGFVAACVGLDRLVAVGLSAHSAELSDVVRETIVELRAALDEVEILIGGRISRSAGERFGPVRVASDASEATRLVDELVSQA